MSKRSLNNLNNNNGSGIYFQMNIHPHTEIAISRVVIKTLVA